MQHTVSFTMPDGGPVREQWTQTTEFCVQCGKQGTWTSGEGPESHYVCTNCKTVLPRHGPTFQAEATDLFGAIADQLAATAALAR